MKERYTPAGSDHQYVVVDMATGRPVALMGGYRPHVSRQDAQEEADRLNEAYARATER